jgi:uncharacterized protein DUF4328
MPKDLSRARRAEHAAAQLTIGLLVACLVLEVGAIGSRYAQRGGVDRAADGALPLLPEGAANAVRRDAVGTLRLAVLGGTGIIWLAWLRQAYGNLSLIGSKRTRFNPRWAIALWLVPLLNLVRPYGVMKDLWLRTNSMNDRDGYDDLPAPGLLSSWWGISLTWGALAEVATWVARDARTPFELVNAIDLDIAVHALGIVAIVLAIRVVRAIDRTQQGFLPRAPDLPTPGPAR